MSNILLRREYNYDMKTFFVFQHEMYVNILIVKASLNKI